MRWEARTTRQKHNRGRERPHWAGLWSGQIPSGFGGRSRPRFALGRGLNDGFCRAERDQHLVRNLYQKLVRNPDQVLVRDFGTAPKLSKTLKEEQNLWLF